MLTLCSGLRPAAEVETGILVQDLLVQVAQFAPWFDPEFVDERAACGLVGVQRLRLAAAPVEGEHQLAAQALAQRVLGDERLELARQLGVAAQLRSWSTRSSMQAR